MPEDSVILVSPSTMNGIVAERIEREVFLGEHPRRERQHFQLVRLPKLFQHPERTERARAVAVIKA